MAAARNGLQEYNLQYGDDKKSFQYYREQGGRLKVARITPDTSITYSVLTFYFKAVQLFWMFIFIIILFHFLLQLLSFVFDSI